MSAKRKIITTNNKELYRKLNMLHFSPEVLLRDVKKTQVDRIIRRINKDNEVLEVEVVGGYLVVRRRLPINFNVYLNSQKKIYI